MAITERHFTADSPFMGDIDNGSVARREVSATADGYEGFKQVARSIYALDATETARAIATLRTNPKTTVSQFLTQVSFEDTHNQFFPQDRLYPTARFFEPGNRDKLLEIQAQSGEDLRQFIALGQYSALAEKVGGMAFNLGMPVSAIEDMAQAFMERMVNGRIDHYIKSFHEAKGTFINLITRDFKYYILDIKRRDNLWRAIMVEEKGTIPVDWRENTEGGENDSKLNYIALTTRITDMDEGLQEYYQNNAPLEAVLDNLPPEIASHPDVNRLNLHLLLNKLEGRDRIGLGKDFGLSDPAVATRVWRTLKILRSLGKEWWQDALFSPLAA